MHIKACLLIITLCALPLPVHADEDHVGHPTVFHAFQLEADVGENGETIATWDLDGWAGTDFNKLWLKSEGEKAGGNWSNAEFWTMYSRNIAEFWDAQIGLRYDVEPQSRSYLTVGLTGLAKYFFETQLHLFYSDEGILSARLRQEHDLLITQRLILQPYLELNLFAQDDHDLNTGAGFSDGDLGLQGRYEISRTFAPYVDFRYERQFGETSQLRRNEGEDVEQFIVSGGIRLLF
jgi:copper resistance protein B